MHRWQPDGLIVRDNRETAHRGRPIGVGEPRHLGRETVADDGYREGRRVTA